MGAAVDTVIRYAVMIGSDGEYSLCRAERCPPPGWRLEGTTGTRAECMACVLAHEVATPCAVPAGYCPDGAGTATDALPDPAATALRRPARGARRNASTGALPPA